MFCTKCGNQLEDGVRFCTYCGAPVGQQGSKQMPYNNQQQDNRLNPNQNNSGPRPNQNNSGPRQNQNMSGRGPEQHSQRPGGASGSSRQYGNNQGTSGHYGNSQGGPRQNGYNQGNPGRNGYGTEPQGQYGPRERAPLSKNAKLVLAIAAATIIVGLGIMIFVNVIWTPTINLNKYVKIEAEGYNKVGTLEVEFDSEDFVEDNRNKIKLKGKKPDNYDGYDNAANYLYAEYIRGNADKTSGLSNGDNVNFIWNIDESEITKNFKVKLKYSDIPYNVSGLKDADTFDIFEKVSLEFSGTSPNGSIEINNENDIYPVNSWTFTADKTEGISNGDKITVTADISDEDIENCLREYGKIPDSTSKEYEVNGLTSDISKLDQIPGDMLEKMKGQVEDKLSSTAASRWDDEVKLTNMTYMGSYLLRAKPDAVTEYDNMVILVYAVDTAVSAKTSDGSFNGKFGFYYYGAFYDMTILDDGTCSVDLNNIGTPNNEVSPYPDIADWPSEAAFSVDGYQNIDTLFNKVVTANIDMYEYESNVDTTITAVDASGKAKAKAKEKKKVVTEGEVFADSSSRLLSEDEVAVLSEADVQTAINELYARHGYRFKDAGILAYFEAYSWYEPTTDSQDVAKSRFNSIENSNLLLLEKYR